MIQNTLTRIIKQAFQPFIKGCCWLFMLLGLSLSTAVYAQKVVSFNPNAAIFSTQQAQVHSQKLQQQLKPQIDRLKKLEGSIQKLQKRYEADKFLLSETEIKQMQDDLQAQVTEARKLQQSVANAKANAEREFESMLYPLLDKVIKAYVKDNEITMIINSEALVYVNKMHDITADLIELLNQQ